MGEGSPGTGAGLCSCLATDEAEIMPREMHFERIPRGPRMHPGIGRPCCTPAPGLCPWGSRGTCPRAAGTTARGACTTTCGSSRYRRVCPADITRPELARTSLYSSLFPLLFPMLTMMRGGIHGDETMKIKEKRAAAIRPPGANMRRGRKEGGTHARGHGRGG